MTKLTQRLTTAAVMATLLIAIASPALADNGPKAAFPATAQTQVLAQTALELPAVSLIPTSRFYFLKSAWEQVHLAMALSSDARAELYAQYAAERLAEAEKLAAAGDVELAAKVLAEFQADLDQVQKLVEKHGVKAKHAVRLGTLLQMSHQSAATVLKHLAEQPAAGGAQVAAPTCAQAGTHVGAQEGTQADAQAGAKSGATTAVGTKVSAKVSARAETALDAMTAAQAHVNQALAIVGQVQAQLLAKTEAQANVQAGAQGTHTGQGGLSVRLGIGAQ